MAKSVRSKWKKRMAKAKTEAEKPKLLQRISKLNNKLDLVATNKISTVPMQDPCPHFYHQHPGVDGKTPLKLQGFTTNVRKGLRGFEGNADGTNAILSAKRLKAEYHPLRTEASSAAVDAARAMDTTSFFATSGGFVNSDDDDDDNNNNNNNNNGGDQTDNSKRTILPKASDIKKTAAKKLKSSEPTGTRSRLVAGGKKQAKYKN